VGCKRTLILGMKVRLRNVCVYVGNFGRRGRGRRRGREQDFTSKPIIFRHPLFVDVGNNLYFLYKMETSYFTTVF